jgi:hypothetical protein
VTRERSYTLVFATRRDIRGPAVAKRRAPHGGMVT